MRKLLQGTANISGDLEDISRFGEIGEKATFARIQQDKENGIFEEINNYNLF